ncbi:HAMP domain-containing sensor histidine kinase [Tsuneonella mangrovi]|uniref:HAMP domain-containing sensor histidine kinase n=1 Tax=Tsuneonella mangrovi TaxID=1982042 RepID=UPI000BA26EE9|nr:ATP-binding protein [Tsuneonella mangrovi]
MRLLPQSAAYRIAVVSAACFALATLLIGATVLYAVHTAFLKQIDDTIEQASVSLVGEFNSERYVGLTEAIAVREASAANALEFAVFSSRGKKIAGHMELAEPPIGWSRITFEDPLEGPDAARALATRLPDGNKLVVAADLEPLDHLDETILVVFAFAFAGTLALGAIFALMLGRYLRRRLDGIAKGSIAFASSNFGGRADVTERGDEFDQVAISLNAMLDRIEALLANLRQVTSDLAHDMRTPLTQLRGQLETLLNAPEAERGDHAEAAIDKCEDILRLFSAILRISEVEGGGIQKHFREVDLAELTQAIAEAHEPAAEESGHTLELHNDPGQALVPGDRDLLAQALSNLVENAMRHTPVGSTIRIGASMQGKRVSLFVADNGPGIVREDRARAMQRFVRLDGARSTPGHGLGLSLVEAVAEAHSARLELDDAQPGLAVRLIFNRMPGCA